VTCEAEVDTPTLSDAPHGISAAVATFGSSGNQLRRECFETSSSVARRRRQPVSDVQPARPTLQLRRRSYLVEVDNLAERSALPANSGTDAEFVMTAPGQYTTHAYMSTLYRSASRCGERSARRCHRQWLKLRDTDPGPKSVRIRVHVRGRHQGMIDLRRGLAHALGMSSTAAPIPFAGSMLGEYRHVCAFFSSPQEKYATLLPFVRDGLERGERGYHIIPSKHLAEHLEQLDIGGIDVAAAQGSGQLEVVRAEDTFLRPGHFNRDGLLAHIQEALKSGATLGFPITRLIGYPETILEDLSGINEFIEFETRLNDVLPSYADPVICLYDTNLLNGTIAVDLLRTHPVAIIGGLLYENPFFVAPQEFLRQLLQRSSGQLAPNKG
jgi:hypothetical protein